MTNKIPFMGETMTCVMCGKQHKSNPFVESGWTTIDVDRARHYICPAELPGPKGSKAQFAKAYERILAKITELHKQDANTVAAVMGRLAHMIDVKFADLPSVSRKAVDAEIKRILDDLWSEGALQGYESVDAVRALIDVEIDKAFSKGVGG